MASQTSRFEDIPRRIFLDSSTLQNLQSYGGFLYENEPLVENARILRDSNGLVKLEALRNIMAIAERAPFQFALSANSFNEVQRKDDGQYLQWAFDVLDHWLACLAESEEQPDRSEVANIFDSLSYNYLGAGDRALLRDAVMLGCDTFLTMENKLPKNAAHIFRTVGIRVFTPIEFWDILRPWAALFR